METRDEVRRDCIAAIRDARLANAIDGRHQCCYLYADGEIGLFSDNLRPMPEVACVALCDYPQGEPAPRDSWEWNAMDDVCEPDSTDAAMMDAALAAAGSWESLIAYGQQIEYDGEFRYIWFERDSASEGWYQHGCEPHDWPEPELDNEAEHFIAEHFSKESSDA